MIFFSLKFSPRVEINRANLSCVKLMVSTIFFEDFEACKAVDVANVATVDFNPGALKRHAVETFNIWCPVHLFGDVFLT